MTRLLVDTSYLVAHFNRRDAHHAKAQEVTDRFIDGEWEQIVLLDSIFIETIQVLSRRASYDVAKQVGETLQNGEEVHWVHTGDLMGSAWHAFLAQPGGRLSLTDCTLLAAAERYGITDIATFDEGFDVSTTVRRIP